MSTASVFVGEFNRPDINWHAVAPELILLGWGALVTIIDVIWLERSRRFMAALTGIGFLLAMIPILTLWDQQPFDGGTLAAVGDSFVIDRYALVLKGLFLLSAYVIVLLSGNYMAEGDYYDSEYYQLIAASVLGMLVMSSARDLVTIFIALELISIPAYLMAAWRKRDLKSNEAGLKYMLMGVFASGILLYGMSLLYGIAGDTKLSVIRSAIESEDTTPLLTLGVLFTIIGFGFKVSAVPFHSWAPDTYEGAPTPLTAFLAVASKTAGFVGLISIIYFGVGTQAAIVRPFLWVLAALTMTVGNLIAIRQENIVRMLAYSGIAQAGYMLAPLAVYSEGDGGGDLVRGAIVNYLVIYAAMNLGAFAVVIIAARKTRSGDISSFGGMFRYAPGLTVAMTIFLFSLTGIPPVGGWLAKLNIFFVLVREGTFWGFALALIAAVNSVIAAFYYLNIAKQMWFLPSPDDNNAPIVIPPALVAALALTVIVTLATGVGIGSGIPDFTVAAP